MLTCLARPAYGLDYPWVLLSPENDSRETEVREQDEAQSFSMVAAINQNETLFQHHLVWREARIKNLPALEAPFCEMHFDAVNPFRLTPEEQSILADYLKRGGFILLIYDMYPYAQDELWAVKQWPIIDFITKDLPASNPDFTAGRATDAFPMFRVHYQTQTAFMMRHELTGNPSTPVHTLLYYRKRLCCFVMGSYYHYLEHGEWVAEPRPFTRQFSMELKGYKLVVNIYTYSILQ